MDHESRFVQKSWEICTSISLLDSDVIESPYVCRSQTSSDLLALLLRYSEDRIYIIIRERVLADHKYFCKITKQRDSLLSNTTIHTHFLLSCFFNICKEYFYYNSSFLPPLISLKLDFCFAFHDSVNKSVKPPTWHERSPLTRWLVSNMSSYMPPHLPPPKESSHCHG